MAGNVDPIYSRIADIQFVSFAGAAAANTAVDGTGALGTTIFAAWAADATNGGYLQALRVKAASSTAATVLRVFLNNGAANTTAANNVLFDEISLPVITASNTGATPPFEIPVNRALPPGYRVLVTIGTNTTGTLQVTGIGGKY